MSFPRYPAYKPSGVEWLGEVPEHWQVKPLKRVADIQTGLAKGKEVEPEGSVEVPFLRVANVQDGFLDLENVHTITISESSLNRYLLRPGDVLMNEGGDFDKLGRGCIWDGTINSCIHQNHVFAVRPHSIRPSWLNVYTSSTQANSYFISRSKQSTNLASISSSNLMDLLVPIAPDSETEEILDFLDRETAKIDALIAEQQRLIELLQEKRQAVISHAVTKGLNQDAPMKDSGVEWLGEVPEHWKVCSFRRLVRIAEGQVDPRIYPYSEMPLIAPNHILSGTGVVGSLETAAEQGAESGKYICEKGAVIYSKIRPALRKACIAPGDCLTSADMYPLHAMEGLSPEFLLYFLLSEQFSALAVVESERVAMPKVNRDTLGAVPLAVPPIPEQVHICSHIKKLACHIDDLCGQAASSIGLMQERRSALISAAVTGQIDVRGLAPEADAA